MGYINRELVGIMMDIKFAIGRAEGSRRGSEIALREDTVAGQEGVSLVKRLENMSYALTDAKHDFDRLVDELKEINQKLDDVVDQIEYEEVVREALKK